MIFNGKQVFINFGNGTDMVKWQVMEITHTGFKKVHFSKYHVKRIETGNQNSAVLILNNSFVKMAEIFSFQKHSIDASVAVKNLRRDNMTLEVIFSMLKIQDSKIHFNGAAPGNDFNLGNGQMKVIPSTAWSASLGALGVNWMGSYSLLHFASVARNNSKDFITLPFGPLSLISNETFLVNLADYVVGIANALAFNIIPSPSYFANSGGTTTPIDVSSYSPPEDSSAPAYFSTGCGAGYFYYPSIQYGPFWSTHSSKIWGVKSVSDYFSNGNIPDYLGIIKYSANVNFVTANDDYTLQTYGISATLTIGVNVQTIGG